eukprot:Lankesteria_metandrocarpae@DN4505_c0_g1_i2.p1
MDVDDDTTYQQQQHSIITTTAATEQPQQPHSLVDGHQPRRCNSSNSSSCSGNPIASLGSDYFVDAAYFTVSPNDATTTGTTPGKHSKHFDTGAWKQHVEIDYGQYFEGTTNDTVVFQDHINGSKRQLFAPVTEDDVHRAFESDSVTTTSRCAGCCRLLRRMKKYAVVTAQRCSVKKTVLRSLPIISAVQTYQGRSFIPDLTGGLSEGIMHVPMGMSYSLLAGLPPEYGLYNSLIFPFVYLFFGTGRQSSVGVSAIESLLCAEAVTSIIGIDAPLEDRVYATLALTLFVGISQLCMRILGLGIIADFLADPVLSGFSTASAFIIGTSQLKYVFGVDVPSLGLPKTWWYIITHTDEICWKAFGIAAVSILFLTVVKILNNRLFRKFPVPGQIIVVVASTVMVRYTDWSMEPHDVDVVGFIPEGLPSPRAPYIPSGAVWQLLLEGIVLGAMFFIIHISITKSIARTRSYRIDGDQELLALGVCNVTGCFFQCFPCASSLSRASLLNSIGSKTILHNIPAVFLVLLTLTLLTPLLYYLPYAALGAIILVGVAGMVDFGEAIRLFSLMSADFAFWVVSFVTTLVLGANVGIILSVILSLLWLLKKACRPNTAVLGNLPDTTIYRDVHRFPMAKQTCGVKVFRFDASLNFSNAEYFESKLLSFDLQHGGSYVVIIDASSVNDLDVTAVRMLQRVVDRFQKIGVILIFANWKGPTRDFLESSHFYDSVPPERCFLCLHDAVLWAEAYVRQVVDGELLVATAAAIPVTHETARSFESTAVAPSKVTHRHSAYPELTPRGVSIGGSKSVDEHGGHSSRPLSRFSPSRRNGSPKTPLESKVVERTRETHHKKVRSLLRAVTVPHPPSPLCSPSASRVDVANNMDFNSRLLGLSGRTTNLVAGAQLTPSTSRSTGRLGTPLLPLPGNTPIPVHTPTAVSPQRVRTAAGERPCSGGVWDKPVSGTGTCPVCGGCGSSSGKERPITAASGGGGGYYYEWDGLSARRPYIRVVEEVTTRGTQRTWGVAVVGAVRSVPCNSYYGEQFEQSVLHSAGTASVNLCNQSSSRLLQSSVGPIATTATHTANSSTVCRRANDDREGLEHS